MGSFNVQCFASRQVIAENEKCRVAVIVQAADYTPCIVDFMDSEQMMLGAANSMCGPNAYWEPKTGFLEATYADYGKFSLAPTEGNKAILAEFFNNLYRRAGKTRPSEDGRDPAFDFQAMVKTLAPKLHEVLAAQKHYLSSLSLDELDMAEALTLWDALENTIRENRVFYATSGRTLRPLQVAAVHETAFQNLIAAAEAITFYGGESYAREPYFSRKLEALKVELADVEDEMKRFVRKDLTKESMRLSLDSSLSTSLLWAFRKDMETAMDAVVDEGQPVSVLLDSCKTLIDNLYALKGLDYLNILFSPLVYSGQDYDNETGKQYAKFIAATSKQVCAKRKARYGKD